MLREQQLERARAGALGGKQRIDGLGEARVGALEAPTNRRWSSGVAIGDALLVGAEIVPDSVIGGGSTLEEGQGRTRIMQAVEVQGAEVGQATCHALPIAYLLRDGK